MKNRRSLTVKLVAAFLGVSLLAILFVALSSAAIASFEFNRLVSQEATNNFISFVTDYYTTHGSLVGVDDALRQRMGEGTAPTGESPRLFPTALTDPAGIVIVSGEGYRLGDQVSAKVLASGTPIQVSGRVIAINLPRVRTPPRNRAQEQFFQAATLALGLGTAGAAIASILLGLFLARTITRPVSALTKAAQQMAKGNLSQTVNVQSGDEVGDLAAAFNQMSADLASADQVRRQMTADIAHELRNPLTVIGGYLDAMRAGDLQPTPTRLDAVYHEIQNLEHLVDDLRTLSLADAGALALNRQPLQPRELLDRVAARYAHQASQKKVALTLEAAAKLPVISADEARMNQVLNNLVSNALRHTPSQGKIRLGANAVENKIQLSIADTGEGIQPEDLPHVFERFYRGDKSRYGGNGEQGLGLAIAKAFVQAHDGKIWAESTPGKGATFVVELPAAHAPG